MLCELQLLFALGVSEQEPAPLINFRSQLLQHETRGVDSCRERSVDQLHACFLWRSVCLVLVATMTSSYKVVPSVPAATASRDDVLKFENNMPVAAVHTAVSISYKDVSP